MLSSEFAAPATYEPGFDLADVQAGRYGHLAGLGGLMLLERASSFDRLLVPIVGAAFLTWGALVLAHPNWLPSILVGGA